MKVLQLCKKFPYPLKDGESIAITYLAKAMRELGSEVTLLAMNTSKHWFDVAQLPPDFKHYAAMHTVRIDNHIRPLDALKNLFSEKSYHIERFDNSDFAAELTRILQNDWFDVVQLETLYLAPYIPVIRKNSSAIIAMRAHNVEHEIWERIASNGNFLKKWYLQKITPRLRTFEIENLNKYDLLIGITDRDVAHFRRLGLAKPAVVTPIGLDCRDYLADDASFGQPLSLGFIGSLDWMPNLEGLKWFLEQVWQPLLSREFPNLTLEIAGRNTPDWLMRLGLKNVKVLGEVPNAAEFINRHSIMVVPLLSGSGMRAKILEGMALGKVVLSTRIGLEGIEARDKKEALIADSPEDFVQSVRWCYEHANSLLDIGQRAQVFCVENFDNLEVAKKLLHTYRNMMPRRPQLIS